IFTPNEEIVTPKLDAGAFVRQGSTEFRSDGKTPLSVQVEDSGPLRTVIRIEGFHASATGQLLRYVTRLTFHAGDSYVNVDHPIIEGRVLGSGNEDLDGQLHTSIDSAGLRVDVQLTGVPQVRVRTASDAVRQVHLAAGETIDLVQHRLTDWTVPLS